MENRFEKRVVKGEGRKAFAVTFRLFAPGGYSEPGVAAYLSASGESISSVSLSEDEAREMAAALLALADEMRDK